MRTVQTINRTRKTTTTDADRPRWLSHPEASELWHAAAGRARLAAVAYQRARSSVVTRIAD